MIYEQNFYNLNILIEINVKNIPNKFIRFKIYDFLNRINYIY